VETPETQELLVSLGCNAGQGYGICKPMPYDDVLDWMDTWRSQAPMIRQVNA
jgi:EAL domain-containing protein (putative c-di-GMP-specific phosphodiesterase class I)